MNDLIKGLRGELTNCECCAHSADECGCNTPWPEQFCNRAADEIERLERELAECKRDAERYRWLREQCEKGDLVIARCGTWELESWFSDDPDAAIDAAQGKT